MDVSGLSTASAKRVAVALRDVRPPAGNIKHRPPLSLTTMSYNKTKAPQQAAQEFYENTKARIQKIQSHLASSPRGIRLKDKVCIITVRTALCIVRIPPHETRA